MTARVPQILLIDDDSSVRSTLAKILGSEPVAFHYARDGDEGLNVLGQHPIDWK